MTQVRREFLAAAGETWRSAAERDLRTAGPQWPLEWGLWLRALLLEVRGEAAQALEVLEQAWTFSTPLRYLMSSRYLGPDLVRLALVNGNRALAASVTAEVAEGARRAGVPTAEGAALRCQGLLDDDPAVLLAAVEAYRKGPRPIDRAFACEDAAAALRRAGRMSEGLALLGEALEIYERSGATRDTARAEAALRALGSRRRRPGRPRRASVGWDSLTETELRVARLAAEGLTNRQIGERLFISRRTVETHLAHVFAKLGLTSRVSLAAEVGRRAG